MPRFTYLLKSTHYHNQGQHYSVAHRFSHPAAEFVVCRRICSVPRKNAELPVISLYLCPIQSFFGLLFNFTIYKTIKSSHCKLTFIITRVVQKSDHQNYLSLTPQVVPLNKEKNCAKYLCNPKIFRGGPKKSKFEGCCLLVGSK